MKYTQRNKRFDIWNYIFCLLSLSKCYSLNSSLLLKKQNINSNNKKLKIQKTRDRKTFLRPMELVELILAFVDQKLSMTNFLLKKKILPFFCSSKKWLRECNLPSEKFLFLKGIGQKIPPDLSYLAQLGSIKTSKVMGNEKEKAAPRRVHAETGLDGKNFGNTVSPIPIPSLFLSLFHGSC